VPHLKALRPDLVIFSIGVNDAHGPNFSKEKFMNNYRLLIAWVREAAPEAALLFITNNDTYIRRRYPNENHKAVQEAMFDLAAECGAGVWDLYSLMGGKGAMSSWHARGLAQSDLIHFSREGYTLIGDKLFEAFLKLWKEFSRPPGR
jgi:lysophospholipase L1-like esterase